MIEMLLFGNGTLNWSQQQLGTDLPRYGGVLAYKTDSYALIVPADPLYPHSASQQSAITQAAQTGYRGFYDWKLPSSEQMDNILLDASRFYQRLNSGALPKQYWTSDTVDFGGQPQGVNYKLQADYSAQLEFNDPNSNRFFFAVRRVDF